MPTSPSWGLPDDERMLSTNALSWLAIELALRALIFVVGLVALVVALRRGRAWTRIGDAVTVAPWTAGAAWAAFVRGFALLVVLGSAILSALAVGGAQDVPPFGSTLILLPLLLLARTELLGPLGMRWGPTLGIPPHRGTTWRLLLLVAAGLAAEMLGDFGIGALAEHHGTTLAWSDSVMEDLLLSPTSRRALVALEAIVVVPLVEEMIFRGLVYPTVRRVGGPLVSALASATIFALMHGYGGVGTALLMWGAVVAALAYEWTGTLLVPVLMHAATNLFAVTGHLRMMEYL